MKLGIALDCTAASAVEVLAYLQRNGLDPDVTVFFGTGFPELAHTAHLYACCDGFVFCRGETSGIGYDRYLRWSASTPPIS
ncbi:MAG: hypothetical protein IKU55_02315, partial [Clostridia bacterium]|nr:hypothetical protein [Clostridia bacterium]